MWFLVECNVEIIKPQKLGRMRERETQILKQTSLDDLRVLGRLHQSLNYNTAALA